VRRKLRTWICELLLPEDQELVPRQVPDRFLWLRRIGIDTVLDIGAHTGRFVTTIRKIFPDAWIYSFEPLDDCYRRLIEAHRDDRKFRGFNLAVGEESGTVPFHRSSFPESSSLLPMGLLHKENFPYSGAGETVTVNMTRLDDIARELPLGNRLLLKIDVQGAERQVLRGGMDVLRRADVILIETNFQSLYEGQWLFKDVLDCLYAEGFRYFGNTGGHLLSPIDGSCLQEDSLFVHSRLVDEKGALRRP
jgi:FkbM family methyltransferase